MPIGSLLARGYCAVLDRICRRFRRGAGLALAALVALRDAGEPLPAGAVLFSPWADLTMISRASHKVVSMNRTAMETAAGMYLRNAALRTARVARTRQAPWLAADSRPGQRRRSVSIDAHELAAKLQHAGNAVEFAQWHAMPHAWQCFSPFMPEARAALAQASGFIRRCWEDATL